MSRIIVRTVYGSALQTSRHLGIRHEIPQFSSLNRALEDNIVIPQLPTVATYGMERVITTTGNQDPTAAYSAANDSDSLKMHMYVIGAGGHRNVPAVTGGVPYTSPIPHKAYDSGLYKMLPFHVVTFAADENDRTIRQQYRLRRTVVIGGDLYVAYYGKVLNISNTAPQMMQISVSGGTSLETEFTPSANNMHPDAGQADLNGPTAGSYLSVSSTLQIPFTATDVARLKNACQLMFGDENYAIISEIGLVTGMDKVVADRYPTSGIQTPVAISGATVYETIGAQIATHISAYYPVLYTNDGFDFTLDLGATEPLYGVSGP